MKRKQTTRVIAFLLSLSLYAAMCPGIVSAEESKQKAFNPGSLSDTCDLKILNEDDPNVASVAENPALVPYSSSTRNAALVSVTTLGHDHYSALNHVRPELLDCGFNNAYLYTGSFSTSAIDSYLDNNSNKVFISRSHGSFTMSEIFPDELEGTYIVLNDDSSNPVRYYNNGTMDTLDLNNLELAMFIGCQTAYTGVIEMNLVTQAVWQGATAAVGFEDNICCDEANQWLKELFDLLKTGETLYHACRQLHLDDNWQATSMASYLIYGYTLMTLTTS